MLAISDVITSTIKKANICQPIMRAKCINYMGMINCLTVRRRP